MNEAVALTAQDVGSTGLGDLMALIGVPSQRRLAPGVAPHPAVEILRGAAFFIDGLLSKAISAQTADEFRSIRNDSIVPYAKTVSNLAKLVRVLVPENTIERVTDEALCEFEGDFRDQGLVRFGAVAKDQAMFTVWSLRRISRILSKVVSFGPIAKDLKSKDQEIAAQFGYYATLTQFHLDCLLYAIREDKSIQLAVLPEIIEGLRAAVNTYGYVREGLDLRISQEEPSLRPYEWDEEDQQLLEDSMRDMERQAIDGQEWSADEAKTLNSQATVTYDEDQKTESQSQSESNPTKPPRMFGNHIREGIEIVKDWIENPTSEQ